MLERLESTRLIGTHALAVEAERAERQALRGAMLDEESIAAAAPLDRKIAPAGETDDVAFLQLTSGSTGIPRGVQITHGAALYNTQAIVSAVSEAIGGAVTERTDAIVSWLPLHHDMGLVGCLLSAITCGIDIVLLPPRLFLARPDRWVRALSEHGRTLSSAPNFGYQTAVEHRMSELDGNLSGWHTALIGAEMVRPETMNAFEDAYGAFGFRREALRPCYGLAEATLAVTFDMTNEGVRTRPAPSEGPTDAREVACLGRAVEGTEVAIVAPDGSSLAEGRIGAVRVRGPGLFAGYYGDAEATAECLRDGWLHTGDLGFLANGELYLTGRTKDILILRGHNLMPHELEWCAEAEADVGGSCRAGAFSIDGGADGEVAVIVVELARPEPEALPELERAIRVGVGRAVGVTLSDVAFVRRGRIPKTTSGKVRRGELREQYLRGELERIEPPASTGGKA